MFVNGLAFLSSFHSCVGKTWKKVQQHLNVSEFLPNFFLCKAKIFPFFDCKLGHFKVQTIFSFATNNENWRNFDFVEQILQLMPFTKIVKISNVKMLNFRCSEIDT
jgi:hypothetical protein